MTQFTYEQLKVRKVNFNISFLVHLLSVLASKCRVFVLWLLGFCFFFRNVSYATYHFVRLL